MRDAESPTTVERIPRPQSSCPQPCLTPATPPRGMAGPRSYRFDHLEATWEAVRQFAEPWLAPFLSGCADSGGRILNAQQFIQAVILYVRLAYAPADHQLDTVRTLLETEAASPGVLIPMMLQSPAPQVVQEARRLQDHQDDPWFGGLGQALLCVQAWQRSAQGRATVHSAPETPSACG